MLPLVAPDTDKLNVPVALAPAKFGVPLVLVSVSVPLPLVLSEPDMRKFAPSRLSDDEPLNDTVVVKPLLATVTTAELTEKPPSTRFVAELLTLKLPLEKTEPLIDNELEPLPGTPDSEPLNDTEPDVGLNNTSWNVPLLDRPPKLGVPLVLVSDKVPLPLVLSEPDMRKFAPSRLSDDEPLNETLVVKPLLVTVTTAELTENPPRVRFVAELLTLKLPLEKTEPLIDSELEPLPGTPDSEPLNDTEPDVGLNSTSWNVPLLDRPPKLGVPLVLVSDKVPLPLVLSEPDMRKFAPSRLSDDEPLKITFVELPPLKTLTTAELIENPPSDKLVAELLTSKNPFE